LPAITGGPRLSRRGRLGDGRRAPGCLFVASQNLACNKQTIARSGNRSECLIAELPFWDSTFEAGPTLVPDICWAWPPKTVPPVMYLLTFMLLGYFRMAVDLCLVAIHKKMYMISYRRGYSWYQGKERKNKDGSISEQRG
jgi:hypothetical protein